MATHKPFNTLNFHIGDKIRNVKNSIIGTIVDFEHAGILRAVVAVENKKGRPLYPLADIELIDKPLKIEKMEPELAIEPEDEDENDE